MKLLLLFLLFSTSVLSYSSIDSVSVFQENGEKKVFIRLKGIFLGSTLTRLADEFVSNDTLAKIDLYVRYCEGALGYDYKDTVVVLNDAIYPEVFNLDINFYHDTNTVYTSPTSCHIHNYPDLKSTYSLSISDIASTSTEQLEQAFMIYPNPASNEISIQTEANIINEEFVITDQLGKVVKRGLYEPKINVNHLSRGQYFFILRTEKYIYRRKFMIE